MLITLGWVVLSLMKPPSAHSEDMVLLPDGWFKPLYKSPDGVNKTAVPSFYIDRYLVTNDEFVAFVGLNPKWNKRQKKTLFHDEKYLSHLSTGGTDIDQQPVTHVSWFAARAYCKSEGKRLPTIAEWEYMGAASADKADGTRDAAYQSEILSWYAKPATATLPNVDETPVNFWGVYGAHGVVWELVNDFNTGLVTGESRGDSQLEQALFCGAGAASSVDPGDYAAFMRYALRSSYEADYTMASLGFRCAKDKEKEQ